MSSINTINRPNITGTSVSWVLDNLTSTNIIILLKLAIDHTLNLNSIVTLKIDIIGTVFGIIEHTFGITIIVEI